MAAIKGTFYRSKAFRQITRPGAARFIIGGKQGPQGPAPTNDLLFTPGGDGVTSIWRVDNSHSQNPRTATIDSVSGDTVTLDAAIGDSFGHWTDFMAGVSYARIWNTTKSPIESAWVKASPTTTTLQVLTAADIASWANGDTVQIGDPTAVNSGRIIALDISPMLQATLGSVFRQSGIIVKGTIVGATVGDAIALSGSGVAGSFVTAAFASAVAAQCGDGISIIPCTELSPISNSNLVMVRETASTTLSVSLALQHRSVPMIGTLVDMQQMSLDARWREVRRVRNSFLTASDWTQFANSPLSSATRAQWDIYRQALRDVTQTFASPEEVELPDPPA